MKPFQPLVRSVKDQAFAGKATRWRQHAAESEPRVVLVGDTKVDYRGRAVAHQRGGTVVVLVKADGSISVHSLARGIRPQFYNPPGKIELTERGRSISISARTSQGEVLRVKGTCLSSQQVSNFDAPTRPPRTRIRGVEWDLGTWIASRPSVVGLPNRKCVREVSCVGGRVDLKFDDVVVEVKKSAGTRAFDQASRYLRDPGVRSVKIACLRASADLSALCRHDRRVEIVKLDESFHEHHSCSEDGNI